MKSASIWAMMQTIRKLDETAATQNLFCAIHIETESPQNLGFASDPGNLLLLRHMFLPTGMLLRNTVLSGHMGHCSVLIPLRKFIWVNYSGFRVAQPHFYLISVAHAGISDNGNNVYIFRTVLISFLKYFLLSSVTFTILQMYAIVMNSLHLRKQGARIPQHLSI